MTKSVTNVMQRLVHTLVLLSGTVRRKKGFMDATIGTNTSPTELHGGYSLLVLVLVLAQ